MNSSHLTLKITELTVSTLVIFLTKIKQKKSLVYEKNQVLHKFIIAVNNC